MPDPVVPGPPAAVLSQISSNPGTGLSPSSPAFTGRATFTSGGAFPFLPSLMTEIVQMPQSAFLDADVTVGGNLTVDGNVAVTGLTDWINAVAEGADPTGATDSTTVIQKALNAAAAGQTVYLPTGRYLISSPVALPSAVTLLGDAGEPSPSQDAGSVLVMSATFSGTAAITLTSTSGTVIGGQARNIGIDGSAAGGSADGIAGTGAVTNAVLENVFIYKVPGAGIDATITNGSGNPHGWYVRHVRVDSAGGNGINCGIHTDGQWDAVHVINSTGHAWSLAGSPANSRFIGCRAEWSGAGKDGFHLVSSWNSSTGSGVVTFVGCSTDRNDNHGMNILATGNVPVILAGCMFRRDGRNGGSGGGSFAGLNVSSASIPVVAGEIAVWPGVDDNGSGTNSPQRGLSVTSSSYVQISSGYIQGASTAVNNGGGNTAFFVSPAVVTATGTTSSPTVNATPYLAVLNGASLALQEGSGTGGVLSVTNTTSGPSASNVEFTAAASGDNMLGMQVSGDSANRFKADATGAFYWGPGNATQDTKLARSAASTLTLTDNSAGNTPQLALTTSVTSAGVPLLAVTNHAAADLAATVAVSGDTNSRFRLDSNGAIKWGPGNATQDCQFSRTAAGLLATDTSTSLDVGGQALGMVQPRNQSLIAWTYDPATATGTGTPSTGTVYLNAAYVARSANSTTISWYVDTSTGVSATASENFVGLFSSAGTLLQSTGVDASLTSTGLKQTTITTQGVTPGFYWLGFVFNFTGTLKLRATGNTNPALINVGTTAATNRAAVNGTGATSLVTITPGSNTTGGGLTLYWFALS